jgi:hypothetical protein
MTRPANGVAADVVINPKKTILKADFANVLKEVERAFVVIEQKLTANGFSVKSSLAGVPAPHEPATHEAAAHGPAPHEPRS